MKTRFLALLLFLSCALPASSAPRIALLVVSRSTDSALETQAQSLISRLVLLRKSAGYTREQLPVLSYHTDKASERELCAGTLGITEDDLPFVGVAELAADGIPSRILFRINRSENAHKDANTAFDEVHEALRQVSSTPHGALTRTRRNQQDGSLLLLIAAGPFRMGRAGGFDDEGPMHEVRLRAYYMARDEVSNAQFKKFVEATQYRSNGHWEEFAAQWGEQAPVVDITWNDAQAYCNWAHLRLPTEAEWEKAARGTDARIYPWGNRFHLDRPRGAPAAIGTHARNVSPYGCLDMVGNVWEWTASWYERYPGNRHQSRAYGSTYRVLRGGSWRVTDEQSLTATVRLHQEADNHFDYVGLRPAADP